MLRFYCERDEESGNYSILVYNDAGECEDELCCDKREHIIPFCQGYATGIERDREKMRVEIMDVTTFPADC